MIIPDDLCVTEVAEYIRKAVESVENWPSAPLVDDICLFCGITDRRRHSWFCSGYCEASYALDEVCQLNLCEMVA